MQAAIKSRQLRRTFVNLRKFFFKLQACSKGYLVRKLIREKGHIIRAKLEQFRKERDDQIRSGKPEAKATDEYEKKYKELMASIWILKDVSLDNNVSNTTAIDDRYVDDVFGFLKDTTTPAGTVRGTGFGVVSIPLIIVTFIFL